jgi:SAM-dependent methyltransferase
MFMEEEQKIKNDYFLDAENAAEMARVLVQGKLITQAMGGPFAGLDDPSSLQTILDIACGPGEWAFAAAQALPSCQVTGIDISRRMIAYATSYAQQQHITNACFAVADITERPLPFADQSFDFINARLQVGVFRREQWTPSIAEYTRMLRPGGVLRLTEMVNGASTNSAAYEYLKECLWQAMWKAGYGFSLDGRDIDMTFMLPYLLRKAGYKDIKIIPSVMEVSRHTEGWKNFYQNALAGQKLSHPLIVKTGVATQEELDIHYARMVDEAQGEDFLGLWYFCSVLGTK